MRLNIIRTILILILISIFFIIFNFSGQDGTTSGGLSKKIAVSISGNIVNNDNMDEIEKANILKTTEIIIRKLAHFSIYALLGMDLMGIALTCNINIKKGLIISIIILILYAISDEIHQLFIPGRTGQIQDVIIDTAGGILGILLIGKVTKHIRDLHKTEKEVKKA